VEIFRQFVIICLYYFSY